VHAQPPRTTLYSTVCELHTAVVANNRRVVCDVQARLSTRLHRRSTHSRPATYETTFTFLSTRRDSRTSSWSLPLVHELSDLLRSRALLFDDGVQSSVLSRNSFKSSLLVGCWRTSVCYSPRSRHSPAPAPQLQRSWQPRHSRHTDLLPSIKLIALALNKSADCLISLRKSRSFGLPGCRRVSAGLSPAARVPCLVMLLRRAKAAWS